MQILKNTNKCVTRVLNMCPTLQVDTAP